VINNRGCCEQSVTVATEGTPFLAWAAGGGHARYGQRRHWEEMRAIEAAARSCAQQLLTQTDATLVKELYGELLYRCRELESLLMALAKEK